MSSNFKLFKELLKRIYGPKIFNGLTNSPNNNQLKLKTIREINDFILGFAGYDNITLKCDDCRNKMTLPRKMDFPSWKGILDFNKHSVRKIMLIGEDVSRDIKIFGQNININITYGLGWHKIIFEEDRVKYYEIKYQNGNEIRKERRDIYLWGYLFDLFKTIPLETILKNIYITDICKCNSEGNNDIKDQCIFENKYIMKEIQLIKPNLILFQGDKALNYIKELVENEDTITLNFDNRINDYFNNYEYPSYPKFGTIFILDRNVEGLKIYHSTPLGNVLKYRRDSLEYYRNFIRIEIMRNLIFDE